MAKELDKLTKEFAPLKKSATTLIDGMAPIGTNFGHFLSMGGEMKDEVTRRVGELRKAGRTGTKLEDFDDDKELKAVLSEVENMKKQMALLVKRSDQALSDGKALAGELKKLKTTLDKTIAERKKKKDRAFLAVDSASLPDLEKLCEQVGQCMTDLDDEVVNFLTSTPYTYDPKSTDKLLQAAVNASASVRAELDEKAMAARGLDLRLLGKNLPLAKKYLKEVNAQLEEAARLYKAGARDKARDRIADATEARTSLQTIADKYALAVKGFNKYDLLAMEQSKDGRQVLADTKAIAEADEEAGQELDKALKKLKF